MEALEAQEDDSDTIMTLVHFYAHFDRAESERLKKRYGIDNEIEE